MARLHTDADGRVLRLDRTVTEMMRAAPNAGAFVLDFDPDTNARIMQQIQPFEPGSSVYPDNIRYTGTVLTISGVECPVNPPHASYTELVALRSQIATFLGGTDLSLANLNKAVRLLVRRSLD